MAVTRLDVKSRQPYADGRSFLPAGAYEQLEGAAHFAVDPAHPDHQPITDIELAPQNSQGLVEFSADFRILRPTNPALGNHTLYLDVLNRGRDRSLNLLNSSASDQVSDPGNGFLMRQGYTLAWCGWQHDVPDVAGLMRIQVPNAPVTGKIAVNFQTNTRTQVETLSERGHRPYPAVQVDDPSAVLTVQDHDEAPALVVPRDQWAFARLENDQLVPDATHLCLEGGFEPGKIYQLVYSTDQAPIGGLGLLGTRDLVSFLRYGDASQGNPCSGELEYAIGFGQSQSGRFLRTLLYLGLNVDQSGRTVFDGIICHVAGARRGEFNQRFAQPSTAVKQSRSNLFPFTDVEQTDPETGQTDGLLTRQSKQGSLPKIFLMNSGCEYWWAHASLIHTEIHTDTAGTKDIATGESVRIYTYAGTQHASGTFPPTDSDQSNGSRGEQLFNWVDYRPALRSSLVNLHQWVGEGRLPPPSQHGRLSDGTLVSLDTIEPIFGAIAGVNFPRHLKRISRLDFASVERPAENLPARVGSAYPVLVPAVDQDGNELAGIRLPDITVPLATHTGWNLRHPSIGGAGQVIGTTGSTIPFPVTTEDRQVSGDPRLSIEERYSSMEDYLNRVEQAAQSLIKDGFLLQEDLSTVVDQARQRYQALLSRTKTPQSADN